MSRLGNSRNQRCAGQGLGAELSGWVKHLFGVSWRVSPAELDRMLTQGSDEQRARVTEAFLAMKRLDLAALREAYGAAAGAR